MEKLKPKKTSSANINDWAHRLENVNPQLARSLDEDKIEGIRGIEELNLPRYKKVEIDLVDFLNQSEKYFDYMESQKFYISVTPRKKGLERFGKANLSREGVLNYIAANISTENQQDYKLVLQQYFENLYGGSIVVGEGKNQVEGEFKSGMMSGIASGYVTPEFIFKRDKHTGVFRYNFENEDVRRIMYNTLLSIPHKGENRDMEFTPGYYELAIVEDDQKVIRPIFTDYRKNSDYQPVWDKQE